MIDVVSATIIRDGRVFLTQRRHDKDYPLTWESPGGKCESGESHGQALFRELEEELAFPEAKEDLSRYVEVGAGLPIFSTQFEGAMGREDRRHIHLHFYLVSFYRDLWPIGREGQGSGWFTSQELVNLKLAPGNVRALATIQRHLKRAEEGR